MTEAGAPSSVELLEKACESERAGRWSAAGQEFARAFQAAVEERSVVPLVDSLRGSARIRQHEGDYDGSDELAELCITVADLHGLRSAAARALSTVAANRYFTSALSEARLLWEDCVERALEAGDGVLAGVACQNLGIVASIRGDLDEARTCYLECIAACTRTGDTSGLGPTYNNLTILCAELGDHSEALLYNDRGIELAEQQRNRTQLTRLRIARAVPLIELGLADEAAESLDLAHRLATEVEDREGLSTVARYRSMLARRSRAVAEAEPHALEALEIAERCGLRLPRAEALEEVACVRHAKGELETAVDTLDEAIAVYRDLNATRDVDRLERLRREWAAAAGSAPAEEASNGASA